MKKTIKYIGLIVGLLFVIPLSINYIVTNGVLGFKPFVTEFNNTTWFQFWYNYIPAIIAFAGTIYAVLQANKQNQRLQDFEKKNFAFSIMPEIKMNLNEAQFKRIIVTDSLKKHDEIKKLYFKEQNNKIKALLKELITEIKKTSTSDYEKILIPLEEILAEEKVNVQSSFLYNSNNKKVVKEAHIINKWEAITKLMSDTNSELKTYIEFNLLNKLRNNELPKLRSMIKGLVVISEENSGVPETIDELFYYRLVLKIRNFSKTDIVSMKFSNIEIQLNDHDKMNFVINSEKEVIIHQNRDGDVPNLDEYIDVFVHLYNDKINFTHDKDTTFKFNYEVTSALGYTYSCVNIISFCEKDKKFSKISFANSIPSI